MADETIQVGDTVKLKSGGPVMTVESVENYGGHPYAHCSWFDGAKRCAEQFNTLALKKAAAAKD